MQTRTVLLYAQDSQGMGHITRTLTIARHLLAAYSDTVAYITTESPIAGDFALPERCDYIKLPATAGLRALRAQLLQDTALGLAPDLVLVDHEPLGHKGEFRDGLRALKAHRPATKFVFGLRDIMDDVGRIRALWRELGVYDAFESLYDGIAVYGSRTLYDVAQAYAIPKSVHPKVHYCGYILRELPSVDPGVLRQQHGLPRNGPLVLATVGSGSDGYPVLEAAQAAVQRLQATFPDLHAILVTGPFMPADRRATLETRATATCRVVPRADNLQLLAAADAVVSMGGYNSVCEALAVARPLVIVPRATHKIEQQIRAETLAAHGLARWVHPKELSGERLAEALEWALSCDRQAHAQRVRDIIPSFDGAARLTAYLSRWLGGD
jgi:predicted glycosyltransferase